MHTVEQEQLKISQRLDDVEDRTVQWSTLHACIDELQKSQKVIADLVQGIAERLEDDEQGSKSSNVDQDVLSLSHLPHAPRDNDPSEPSTSSHIRDSVQSYALYPPSSGGDQNKEGERKEKDTKLTAMDMRVSIPPP